MPNSKVDFAPTNKEPVKNVSVMSNVQNKFNVTGTYRIFSKSFETIMWSRIIRDITI